MQKIKYILPLFVFLPSIVMAQPTGPAPEFGYIGGFFREIMGFINNILVPLVFAIALLAFIYGMYLYFIQGGASDDSRQKGQQLALWAIIGFVLMVSIWGIVNLIATGLFGSGRGEPPRLPGTPTYEDYGGSAPPTYDYGSTGPS